MSNEGQIIGEIKKDDNNILRISIQEYNGHKYVDIRKWFRNGKGHMIRTKYGITISKKSIDIFMIHIKDAYDYFLERDPF